MSQALCRLPDVGDTIVIADGTELTISQGLGGEYYLTHNGIVFGGVSCDTLADLDTYIASLR